VIKSDTNRLENSLFKAGFTNVRTERLIVTFEFTSGEDYSQYCQAVSASARLALSKESEDRKREIWKRVAEQAVSNYGIDSGIVRMDNESICIVGTRL
jgi:hypothetical protein